MSDNNEESEKDDFVSLPAQITIEEQLVYDHLTNAWYAFKELPVLFSRDLEDFSFWINQLKSVLLSRVGLRSMGWEYEPTPPATDDKTE